MRIFLVRHGESLGNLDERAYSQFGDHNVPLTQWGYRQASEAGSVIAVYLAGLTEPGSKPLRIWYSPFLRTRQSKDALLDALPARASARSARIISCGNRILGSLRKSMTMLSASRNFPTNSKMGETTQQQRQVLCPAARWRKPCRCGAADAAVSANNYARGATRPR